MTGIGKSEYPELTLTDAIRFVEAIKRDKVQTVPALAKAMGLSTHKSGFANQRISALAKYYGLIERDKNNITLTLLGRRIVYPVSPQDRQNAIREAALKVDLFRSLFQSLGASYHELDFPAKLMEVAHASHEEVSAMGTKVERLYSDATRYMGEGHEKPETPREDEGKQRRTNHQESTEKQPGGVPKNELRFQLQADDRHWMYQDGETVLRVEKNLKKVRTAMGMLKVWLDETTKEPGSQEEGGTSSGGSTESTPPEG